jgi:hypothetical protein
MRGGCRHATASTAAGRLDPMGRRHRSHRRPDPGVGVKVPDQSISSGRRILELRRRLGKAAAPGTRVPQAPLKALLKPTRMLNEGACLGSPGPMNL